MRHLRIRFGQADMPHLSPGAYASRVDDDRSKPFEERGLRMEKFGKLIYRSSNHHAEGVFGTYTEESRWVVF